LGACADQTSPPRANDLGRARPAMPCTPPKRERRHAAIHGLLAPANWKEPSALPRRRWGRGRRQTARWCGLHRLGTRWRPALIRPFVPFACPEHDQDDRAEGNKRDEPPPPGLPGVVEPASAHREVRDDERKDGHTNDDPEYNTGHVHICFVPWLVSSPNRADGYQRHNGREDHEVVQEREPPELRSRGPAPKLRVFWKQVLIASENDNAPPPTRMV